MKSKWRLAAIWFYSGAIVALIAAIITYRGGNSLNPIATFTWNGNFLSDLGLVTTQNGQAQTLGRALFTAGLLLTGLMFSYLTAALSAKPISRVLAALAGLFIFGVALAPSDVYFHLHRQLLVAALVLMALTWSLLATHSGGQSKALLWVAAVINWGYLLFILIAPRPEAGLAISSLHAQVQKSVVLIFFITCALVLAKTKVSYTD